MSSVKDPSDTQRDLLTFATHAHLSVTGVPYTPFWELPSELTKLKDRAKCQGIVDLFLPRASTGARYAYLFDRAEVLDMCSSECAAVFEVLVQVCMVSLELERESQRAREREREDGWRQRQRQRD